MLLLQNIIILSRFFRQLMKNIDYYLPAEIKLLLILIILFTLCAITFFCIIIFSRFYKNYREKKRVFLKLKIELLITSVVFEENMETYENMRKKQKLILHYKQNYLKSKFSRQVLIEEILKLYKDLIGMPAENLRQLYLSFELDADSMAGAKMPFWAKLSGAAMTAELVEILEIARLSIVKLLIATRPPSTRDLISFVRIPP